jgi:deoxyadenosine/deoxycytidine kinase
MRIGPARCIAISGNIGTGKSTLVEFLTKHFSIEPLYEPNDENPYLKDFYADMPRWAFHSQMFFLVRKFKLHQQAEAHPGAVLVDRTIYEDAEIFAANLAKMGSMPAREWETYQQMYRTLVDLLRPPDLMIYLRCSLSSIKKRIGIRGRPEEQAIPDEYLKRLNRMYDRWYSDWDRSPSLVLRTDRIDYVSDLVDQADVLDAIERTVGGLPRPGEAG